MKAESFELTNQNFNELRELVYRYTGISLQDTKMDMVRRRFTPRLRELGLSNFSQYCDLCSDENESELINFTNAITTNLTSFFRENHHFDYLRNELLPDFLQNKGCRKLRIWSAGCSTGEEPYSIAMTIYESIPDIENWDIKILATDIDTDILARASAGIYKADRFENLPSDRIRRWFLRGKGKNEGLFQAGKSLKELVSFRHLNLMGRWPMRQNFDIIFCRNVLIYFDADTQTKLIDRYGKQQDVGSHLFLGHSESVHATNCYKQIGKTIYRRALDN